MDIKVIVRKSLIFSSSLIISLAIYTYVALAFKVSIEKYWNVSTTWTAVILVGLVVLGFPVLKSLIEKAVETLFKGKKSIDLAVKGLREQISQKKDLEALIEVIGKEIQKYLKIEQVKCFILNRRDKSFEWAEESMTERIEGNNELVRYFEKYPRALVREEIPHLIEEYIGKFDKEILQKAEKEMKKRQASLALPYRTEDEVYAILMLGKRDNDQPYTIQDVEYLERMREQVNFTLASAVLYRDVMDRIRLQTGQTI
jgi:transcriptional regulator with GAF, ATPase, and Fis domain